MQTKTRAALAALATSFETLAGAIRKDTESVLTGADPIEVVIHFNDLRLAMERVKTARKAVEELIDQLSAVDIPAIFSNKSLKTMNIEGVGRVTVAYRWSASILDDPKKGKLIGMEWLKKNGLDAIVIETVNSSTLAAVAKERSLDGSDLPEKLFKVGQQPYTSITKA